MPPKYPWYTSRISLVLKARLTIQQDSGSKSRQCQGMYSRKDWGGNTDPFIMVNFIKPDDIPEGQDPLVSFVLFEWDDKKYLGAPSKDAESGEVNGDYARVGLQSSLTRSGRIHLR